MDPRTVKCLCEHGSMLETDKCSVLLMCVLLNHLEVFDLLIEMGADPKYVEK